MAARSRGTHFAGPLWVGDTGPGNPAVVFDVKAYGAVGNGTTDDTAAIQAALDACALTGGRVYAPRGTYRITSSLTWAPAGAEAFGLTLVGDGMEATIFEHAISNGPLVDVQCATTGGFVYGGEIGGFRIQSTANPNGAIGLRMQSCWLSTIRNVRIEGLSSDAIQIVLDQSDDSDGTSNLVIEHCYLTGNGGYGINVNAVEDGIAVGHLHVRHSFITSNAGGGVRWIGLVGRFEHNSIAWNAGTGGFYAPYNGTVSQVLIFDGNECDSNLDTNMYIEGLVCGRITENQFTALYDAELPVTTDHILLGAASGIPSVQNVEIARNRSRIGPLTSAIHVVRFRANTYNNSSGGWFETLSNENTVMAADLGSFNRIQVEGQTYGSFASVWKDEGNITTGTYTPNLAKGAFHRAIFTGSSETLTIANPVYTAISTHAYSQPLQDGMELELLIVNNSSVTPITPTLGNSFKAPAVPSLANTPQFTTAKFRRLNTNWYIVGDWTPATNA